MALTKVVLGGAVLRDPTLGEVLLHEVLVERVALARLDLDLRGPPATKLDPRPCVLVGTPAVVERADTANNPRPQERLACALDNEVVEHEELVEVTVACRGLAERMRACRCNCICPDEGDFLEERVRD